MQATQEGLSGFTLASLGVLFVALWCLTSLFMSWQSGWRLLSKRFPAQSEFLAETKKGGISLRYLLSILDGLHQSDLGRC